MIISFFRGNDHEVKFKFKTFTGAIEKMWLTVKCQQKIKRLQKTLGNGIELVNGYYVVTFVPKDTDELPCDLELVYDIEIQTGGKIFTAAKNTFEVKEDVTTPKDKEV